MGLKRCIIGRIMKVAIIGCGGMGQFHASLISEMKDFEIVAFVDVDVDKAKLLAKKYGVSKYYKNWQDAVRDEEVEGVIICTPVKFHKEIAVGALEAGKHVLCEKPPAMNAGEAEEMADVAKSSGRVLMYAFQYRFYNTSQQIRELVREGCLGEVYRVRIHYLRTYGIPNGWFRLRKFAGGGPLIDCGVHFLDLVYWICGRPKPVSAFGKAYKVLTKGLPNFDVEDSFVGMVLFDNGMSMVIETSWVQHWYNEFLVMIYGSKAGVRVYPDPEVVRRVDRSSFEVKKLVMEGWREAHIKKLRHFKEVVESGYKDVTPSPEDGVVLMKIIDALYKSAELGRSVEID